MVEYCNTTECLREFLLRYFGEKCESCSGCSNCAAEFREEDITEQAQKIISCVFRLKQRGIKFAAGAICSVLTGENDKRTEQFNLTAISTYGIMKGYNKKRLAKLTDDLVRLGYLDRNEEEYKHITITEKGHTAVKNREKITVKVPIKKEDFLGNVYPSAQGYRYYGEDRNDVLSVPFVERAAAPIIRILRYMGKTARLYGVFQCRVRGDGGKKAGNARAVFADQRSGGHEAYKIRKSIYRGYKGVLEKQVSWRQGKPHAFKKACF